MTLPTCQVESQIAIEGEKALEKIFSRPAQPRFSRLAALNQLPIGAANLASLKPCFISPASDAAEDMHTPFAHPQICWATRVYIGVDFTTDGQAWRTAFSALIDHCKAVTPNGQTPPYDCTIDVFDKECAFIRCKFREGTIFGEGCEFGGDSVIPANCNIGTESVFRRKCHIGESCLVGEDCELGVGATYDCHLPDSTQFVRRKSSSVFFERMRSIRESRHGVLPAAITNGTAVQATLAAVDDNGQITLLDARSAARKQKESYTETFERMNKERASHTILNGACTPLAVKPSVRDGGLENQACLVGDIIARVKTDALGQSVVQLFKIESRASLIGESALSGDKEQQKILATAMIDGMKKRAFAERPVGGEAKALLATWDAGQEGME